MFVTQVGIETDVRPTQSLNEYSPMNVAPLSIVTDANLEHS